MTQSSTVGLERLSPHIAKVTFSNPPANLIVPETVLRLHDMVVELSQDPDIKVVLFTSSLASLASLALPFTHKKAGTNHLIQHPRRRNFGAQTPQS